MKKLVLSFFVVGVLLVEGSFLAFAGGKARVGWYVTYGKIEGTKASLSTDSHSGEYSAYVKTTSSVRKTIDNQKFYKGGWTQGWSYKITPLLKPNSEYVLAGWIKADLKEESKVEFSIHLYDKSPGKTMGEKFHGCGGKMKGVNNWTYKKHVIKTPDTIDCATIYFILLKEGEAWLDDVTLIDVSTGKNLLKNPGFEIIEKDFFKDPGFEIPVEKDDMA